MKLRGFDLNEKGSPGEDSGSGEGVLGSSLEKETPAERIEDGECTEEAESKFAQLVENESKRSRAEDTEDKEDVGSIKKRLKREGLDCKLQLPGTGRALRSRFASKTDNEEESDLGKCVDVVTEKDEVYNSGKVVEVKRKRGRPCKEQVNDRPGNKEIEVELEESNCIGREVKVEMDLNERPNGVQLSDESADKAITVEDSQQFGEDSKMVNQVCEGPSPRKRGRPPKGRESDSVETKIVSGKDREDSLNVVEHVGETRKRGRGRPPKVHGGQGVVKGDLNGGKKSYELRKGDKDSKLKNSSMLIGHVQTKLSKKINIRKSSKAKRLGPPSKKVNDDDIQSGDAEALQGVQLERKPRKKERLMAKQAVRDKIIGLIMAAGWTIDYRPRNGRKYNDAVYVNPEGNTHWSITKAYRALKESFESGNADSKTSNFTFTPIPDEELSILYKVMTKKREGKKKSNGEMRDESMESEGEAVNGKTKRKWKSKRKRREADAADGWKNGKKSKKRGRKSKLTRKDRHENSAITLSGRKYKPKETQNRKRCALLVRNSLKGANSDNDGYVLYNGKRTVLSWMIDLGSVDINEKVKYMDQSGTLVQEGRITRDGIFCECCSEVFDVAAFESHTGGKLNEPYQNICLESGKSLLQCMYDSWNKQEESRLEGFHLVDVSGEDPNDDTCGVCGDGGNLICCDGCPSTFHQSCLYVKKFPTGEWRCIFCTCKFCGMVGEKMKPKESEDDEALSELQTCSLCEEKYHQECIQMKGTVSDDSGCPSFCGKKCEELFEKLQMLVGVRHEVQDGFSWTLTHRFDISSDVCLKDAYQKVESNGKLAVALSVMDECFLPHVDHRSGTNLIPNIVYNFGSNFNRLNYSGFFTAILERGDEIIAAASIRIHGNQLAEMPFIGTRYTHRRQGMCRRLLNAIESALSSLSVEKLVIPAISEMKESWISVFGFKPLNASSKRNMRKLNILTFPGVDMLQKPLLMNQFSEENTSLTESSVAAPDKNTVEVDSIPNKESERKMNQVMIKDGTDMNNRVDAFVCGSEDSGQNAVTEMPGDAHQTSPSACLKAKDLANRNHAGFDANVRADDHEQKLTTAPETDFPGVKAQTGSKSPEHMESSGNVTKSDPKSGVAPHCASM